jgi:cyclopropane-fatty-acyl-phospholipid synthase
MTPLHNPAIDDTDDQKIIVRPGQITKNIRAAFNQYDWATKMALRFFARLMKGQLTLHLPDGQTFVFIAPENGLSGELHVHHPDLAKRVVKHGILGFHDAYIDGDWDSPDMEAFFKTFLMNEEAFDKTKWGHWFHKIVSFIRHKLRFNSKAQAKRNIARHYDLGNDFYDIWLDDSWTYSAGLFNDNMDKSLHQAQLDKYQQLIDDLDIQPHHQVLEVGCGWGGFADYVTEHVGAAITGITISREQAKFAKNRLVDRDEAVIQLTDYREITGEYDRIVSIEMIEAVGMEYWPLYFNQLSDHLKPDGKIGIQAITIDDDRFDYYQKNPDYIQQYIFPGGMLLSPHHMQMQAKDAGLHIDHIRWFGTDYAETLRRWNDRFQDGWDDIQQIDDQFDERFKRMWEQYLLYCAAGFSANTIDVAQFILTHRP